MTDQIQPDTPAWVALRDQIIECEVEATEHANAAREWLLKQGDLFDQVAPKGTTKANNGTGALLRQMAEECGIAQTTATDRRDLSASVPGRMRQMLRDAPDILVSFGTLRTIVADDNPEVLLRVMIEGARQSQRTRITRDDVRRARGMVTGTVGTPEATAERIARDPAFAAETMEALGNVAKGLPESERNALLTNTLTAAMGETPTESRQKRERQGREDEARQAAQGPPLLRPGLGFIGAFFDFDAFIYGVVEEYQRDEQGAQVARDLADMLDRRAAQLRAWANGEYESQSSDDFEREARALLGGDA